MLCLGDRFGVGESFGLDGYCFRGHRVGFELGETIIRHLETNQPKGNLLWFGVPAQLRHLVHQLLRHHLLGHGEPCVLLLHHGGQQQLSFLDL